MTDEEKRSVQEESFELSIASERGGMPTTGVFPNYNENNDLELGVPKPGKMFKKMRVEELPEVIDLAKLHNTSNSAVNGAEDDKENVEAEKEMSEAEKYLFRQLTQI